MDKNESGLVTIERKDGMLIEIKSETPILAESTEDINVRIEALMSSENTSFEVKEILLFLSAKFHQVIGENEQLTLKNEGLTSKNETLNTRSQELIGEYKKLDLVHQEVLNKILYDTLLKTLYARGPGTDMLLKEVKRTIRKENGKFEDLGLIVFDVDKFKTVNDLYGHLVGDEVLYAIAKSMTLKTRDTDIAARFGGDEFFVALPDCPIQNAENVAKKIQEEIVDFSIEISDIDLHNRLQARIEIFVAALTKIDSTQEDKIILLNNQINIIKLELDEFEMSRSFIDCLSVMDKILASMIIKLNDDVNKDDRKNFTEQLDLFTEALPHFANTKRNGLQVSVSIGVGVLNRDELGENLSKIDKTKQAKAVQQAFYKRIDGLAYQSKGKGRNQITSETDVAE